MSQAILNRIAAIRVMALHVPSYAAEKQRLEAQIAGAELDGRFEQIEDDLEDLDLEAGGDEKTLGYLRNIYVDAVNGNDENLGVDANNAIKTFERFAEIYRLDVATQVNVIGEYLIDKLLVVRGYLSVLRFKGVGPDAALRFMNDGNQAGGFSLFGGGHIEFLDIKLIDDTTAGGRAVNGGTGSYFFRFSNVEVSKSDASIASGKTSPLFNSGNFGVINVLGLTLDDSTGGVLFHGVLSGANPKSLDRIVCNTSSF